MVTDSHVSVTSIAMESSMTQLSLPSSSAQIILCTQLCSSLIFLIPCQIVASQLQIKLNSSEKHTLGQDSAWKICQWTSAWMRQFFFLILIWICALIRFRHQWFWWCTFSSFEFMLGSHSVFQVFFILIIYLLLVKQTNKKPNSSNFFSPKHEFSFSCCDVWTHHDGVLSNYDFEHFSCNALSPCVKSPTFFWYS